MLPESAWRSLTRGFRMIGNGFLGGHEAAGGTKGDPGSVAVRARVGGTLALDLSDPGDDVSCVFPDRLREAAGGSGGSVFQMRRWSFHAVGMPFLRRALASVPRCVPGVMSTPWSR